MATLIDSITITGNDFLPLRDYQQYYNYSEGHGTVFKIPSAYNGYKVTSVQVGIKKTSSPTGSVYARIYSDLTGTAGTDCHPVDFSDYEAQSEGVGASTISTSFEVITFTFTDCPNLTDGIYFLVIYYPDGVQAGYLNLQSQGFAVNCPSGYNTAFRKDSDTSWSISTVNPFGFKVYGDIPVIGGSEVDVEITAEGSGIKKTESGSEADTDITPEGGAGEKIAYSTSSYGTVEVSAEGGGRGIVMYQFISDPTVKLQQPVATHVKVVSPDYTTGYTAVISPAPSADKAKYRFVEIPEGDSTVCQQVAESLLAKWSVERKNVVGKISLNFALAFEEYVYVSIPQAGIEEELIIQKLVHDISNMTTTMTLGDDVLLNDDELIARIIDELS